MEKSAPGLFDSVLRQENLLLWLVLGKRAQHQKAKESMWLISEYYWIFSCVENTGNLLPNIRPHFHLLGVLNILSSGLMKKVTSINLWPGRLTGVILDRWPTISQSNGQIIMFWILDSFAQNYKWNVSFKAEYVYRFSSNLFGNLAHVVTWSELLPGEKELGCWCLELNLGSGLISGWCPRKYNGDATQAVCGGRCSDGVVSDSNMDSKCQRQNLKPDRMILNT